MTTTASTTTTTARTTEDPACSPALRVTRSLLGYGVVAGPLYVSVALAQAFTRDGFDPRVHAWSQLALGDHGWIQIANLALTGLMVIAFAAGLARALGHGRASRWAPRLIGVFGASMVVAAAFTADPSYGFPAGTADGAGTLSWHGNVHLMGSMVGFTCLAAAALVLARRFSAAGDRGWARGTRTVAIAFLASFVAMGASGGAAAGNLAFTAGIVMIFGWLTAVAVREYRTAQDAR